MTAVRRGAAAPYTSIRRGVTPIRQVRRGSNLIWTNASVYDAFNGPDGFLTDWVNELASLDLGDLISDGLGFLIDGLGNIVGTTVALVEDAVNGLGELVSTTSTSLVDAYCGAWGGTAPPNGLIGMVNGIPIIGELIGSLLGEWLEGDLDIQSLIGKIPVFGQLAEQIGLIPDQLGNLADPINYVVDAVGDVIGVLTCGAFHPTGGSLENVGFVIGQMSGAARMLIPDGLMNLDLRTNRMRHPTQLPADNGFIEVQVAEIGSPGYATQAWRRYANDGSGARGVGIDLRNSQASIIRRVGSVDTLVAENVASFTTSTRLRLDQAGNIHTLVRDGVAVGSWNDAGATAASGASNRSVAMTMQGSKERAGTRKFSPSLNYLEAA